MLLTIHPDNPQGNKIAKVVDALKAGGVIIYPTDTLYGLGCAMQSAPAIEKLCRLRGLDPRKANLTVIVKDIQQLSTLVKPLDRQQFRLIKKHVPGPFTFILNSTRSLPKSLRNRKDTLGIRIVDNPITNALLEELGAPILSISFKDSEESLEYPNDPVSIHEAYGKQVAIVIDGGTGGIEPSTIVDFTSDEPEVLRSGLGEFLDG